MGLFDIFSTQDQEAAAKAQIAGLNAGNAQATGNINSAIGSLNSNYGAGSNALTSGYGNAGTALQSNYTKALQPYLTNYGQAQGGVQQLGNVLGLNGPAGSDAALTALRSTPGYKFQQESQDASVNAAAAANGTLNSGNQLLALNKVNQGLADSTYGQYVSQLQPYLNASQNAASGIAGTYQGLGQGQAGLATGLGQSQANLSTGLGQATAGQYDTLAGLNYQTQTGIGNANANADLAGLTASGNIWNMVGNIGKTAASVAPFVMSDKRLKQDITPVGELYDGQEVFRYRYIGSPVWQIGLMAQDVEKVIPDAVTEVGGYKAVNLNTATQYASELSRFLEAA